MEKHRRLQTGHSLCVEDLGAPNTVANVSVVKQAVSAPDLLVDHELLAQEPAGGGNQCLKGHKGGGGTFSVNAVSVFGTTQENSPP